MSGLGYDPRPRCILCGRRLSHTRVMCYPCMRATEPASERERVAWAVGRTEARDAIREVLAKP